jgi:hypothetical protein
LTLPNRDSSVQHFKNASTTPSIVAFGDMSMNFLKNSLLAVVSPFKISVTFFERKSLKLHFYLSSLLYTYRPRKGKLILKVSKNNNN